MSGLPSRTLDDADSKIPGVSLANAKPVINVFSFGIHIMISSRK